MCLSYVVRSTDGGATWGRPALIAGEPARRMSFEEPALSLTPSGDLIAIAAHGARTASTRTCTRLLVRWRPHVVRAAANEMWGYPAHVFTALDGRMVCSYGYRRQPYGVRACASADGGKTLGHRA